MGRHRAGARPCGDGPRAVGQGHTPGDDRPTSRGGTRRRIERERAVGDGDGGAPEVVCSQCAFDHRPRHDEPNEVAAEAAAPVGRRSRHRAPAVLGVGDQGGGLAGKGARQRFTNAGSAVVACQIEGTALVRYACQVDAERQGRRSGGDRRSDDDPAPLHARERQRLDETVGGQRPCQPGQSGAVQIGATAEESVDAAHVDRRCEAPPDRRCDLGGRSAKATGRA